MFQLGPDRPDYQYQEPRFFLMFCCEPYLWVQYVSFHTDLNLHLYYSPIDSYSRCGSVYPSLPNSFG
jgi:hypothetical protein